MRPHLDSGLRALTPFSGLSCKLPLTTFRCYFWNQPASYPAERMKTSSPQSAREKELS